MEKEGLQKKGKPWKKASRVHSRLAKTCLTETEKLLLQAKAKAAGMSESEWLRAAIRQRVVVARLTPGEANFVRHLTSLHQHVHRIRKFLRHQGISVLEEACQGAEQHINHLLLYLDCDDRQGTHE